MRTTSLLAFAGIGAWSFTSALPIASDSTSTSISQLPEAEAQPPPEFFPPPPPKTDSEPPPPPTENLPVTEAKWQPYTAPPPPSQNQQQSLLLNPEQRNEDTPEVFPVACSVSSFGGGSMVLHWVQKDGSCKSRLQVRTRALFKWGQDAKGSEGERVLVGEESV